VIPTPRIIEQPQAVGELAELLEIPFGHPIAPGASDILEFDYHLL